MMCKYAINALTAIGLILSAASASFAQTSQAQMLQDLLRDTGTSGGGLATPLAPGARPGMARPNPPQNGQPQLLPSADLSHRVERACRYEEMAGERVNDRRESAGDRVAREGLLERLYKPNAFERYVKGVTGKELCRFGFNAGFGSTAFFEPPPLGMVHEDYVLGPGDEVYIRAWGSLELNFSTVIDRSGQVVIPRIGPVKLAGVTYGKSANVLKSALKRLYSDFDASLTMGQLRGIRVYITGYAEQPGALTVHNLASLSSVVFSSGGPSIAGSLRTIELRRRGEVIARLDLYKLLLEGDKSADRPLLSEDVIHFDPIGAQVAVLGGVNKPGVFEIRGGESAQDVIRMAGNYSPGGRAESVAKLSIVNRDEGFKTIAELKSAKLADGDILIVADASMLVSPKDRMVKRVVVQGQVRKPGEYFLSPKAKLTDAIDAAGGLVPGAFIYGLKLTRRSVLEEQKTLLDRILRELDRDLVSQSAMTPKDPQDAQAISARLSIGKDMINRLQSFQPEGRLLLPIAYNDKHLPEVDLQDGDSISVPDTPASVGVYGSVTNAGTFVYDPKQSLAGYISLAGGATRGADEGQTFVILANGQARKAGSGGAFFGRNRDLDGPPRPGDTVVVPEDMQKTNFTRELIQYTTILYQLGLGAAAIKVLKD